MSWVRCCAAQLGRNERYVEPAPFIAFVLLAFTGCPSLPPPTSAQQAAAASPPKAGMAKIIVYRYPSFRGGGVLHFVFVDGDSWARFQQGKFMVAAIAPGVHTVACGHESVTFHVGAGFTYYFEGDTHWYLGDAEHGGEIMRVAPEEAKPRLSLCQQVISNF